MKEKIEKLKKRISSIKKILDIEEKKLEKKSLEEESIREDFWKNQNMAKKIMKKISNIESLIQAIEKIEGQVKDLEEYFKISTKKDYEEIENEYSSIDRELSKLELNQFLSGKYDRSGAILSIHSGQGGTEANDWTDMILRMYKRYAEKQDWQVEEIHKVKGEEVGLSTVTIEIDGLYAYGYLKNETGTHRLVRISPYNAQSLRQTSFAGVEVLPIIDEIEEEIEIKKEDIEFKATKSGGPGGQNVNKTSTAVTITHLPTGITIHSSSSRSQLQNREAAMELLKSKLWAIKEEQKENEKKKIKGEHKMAAWGNQIRNYILHPYKLVKDLRTKVESKDPIDVLDGNLDRFVEEEIKLQKPITLT